MILMVFGLPVQPWLVRPDLSDGIYACQVQKFVAKHDSLRSRNLEEEKNEGKLLSKSFQIIIIWKRGARYMHFILIFTELLAKVKDLSGQNCVCWLGVIYNWRKCVVFPGFFPDIAGGQIETRHVQYRWLLSFGHGMIRNLGGLHDLCLLISQMFEFMFRMCRQWVNYDVGVRFCQVLLVDQE